MGDDIKQQVTDLTEETFKAVKNAQDLIAELSKFDTVVDTLGKVNTKIQQYADTTGHAEKEVADLNVAASEFISLLTKFNGFDKFGQSGVAAAGSITSQFEELKTKFGGFSGAIEKIKGIMPNVAKALVELGKDGVAAFLASADQGAKLEQGVLGLAASTGNLNKIFEIAGRDLKDLGNITAQYAQNLSNVQTATHLSSAQLTEYVMTLGKVPGVMEQTINVTRGGFTESMGGLIAITKLSALAHINASDAAQILGAGYEDLGNASGKVTDSTQKGVNMFSLMIDSSNKLGLRFEDTRKFLTDTAKEFKFVGDNTEAANRILNTFSTALQNTGLTAKASMDVVDDMVKSVNNLSVGTKALLSVRSGGPGGLQGAFRIDRLIREGKTDEVIQMMTRSLKQQLGGRILSLDEADKSPQAASQFYRQRSLLQSGAFGSLVGTGPQGDAKANRLLDALSKGQLGAAGELLGKRETTENAVTTSIDKGTSVQERQASLLQDMVVSLDVIAQNTAVGRNETLRKLVASDVEERAKITKNANSRLVSSLREQESGQTPLNHKDTIEKSLRPGMGLFTSGVQGFKALPGRIGQEIASKKEQLTSAMGAFKNDNDPQIAAGQKISAGAVERGQRMLADSLSSSGQLHYNASKMFADSVNATMNQNQNAGKGTQTASNVQPPTQKIIVQVDLKDVAGSTIRSEINTIDLQNGAAHSGGIVEFPNRGR